MSDKPGLSGFKPVGCGYLLHVSCMNVFWLFVCVHLSQLLWTGPVRPDRVCCVQLVFSYLLQLIVCMQWWGRSFAFSVAAVLLLHDCCSNLLHACPCPVSVCLETVETRRAQAFNHTLYACACLQATGSCHLSAACACM